MDDKVPVSNVANRQEGQLKYSDLFNNSAMRDCEKHTLGNI